MVKNERGHFVQAFAVKLNPCDDQTLNMDVLGTFYTPTNPYYRTTRLTAEMIGKRFVLEPSANALRGLVRLPPDMVSDLCGRVETRSVRTCRVVISRSGTCVRDSGTRHARRSRTPGRRVVRIERGTFLSDRCGGVVSRTVLQRGWWTLGWPGIHRGLWPGWWVRSRTAHLHNKSISFP